MRGEEALNQLCDEARAIAPALGAEPEFDKLDSLIGALFGTRGAPLRTAAGRARSAGLAYDPDRLARFEVLRAELSAQPLPDRPAPEDPARLFAFFEAYFSNWIEGTVFEVEEAEEIVFERRVPAQRPADAHDIQGTFDAITDRRLRVAAPGDPDELEQYVRDAHRRVMGGRPDVAPGEYSERPNRAGATYFVHPELVRGTLREGFRLRDSVPPGLARAAYMMLLASEVHPFADGNGRVARLVMNAELSAVGACRVMIPLSYRDEYMSALRALSLNDNPTALWRMLDRAQRWAASIDWTSRRLVTAQLTDTNALVPPDEAQARNLHLRDSE